MTNGYWFLFVVDNICKYFETKKSFKNLTEEVYNYFFVLSTRVALELYPSIKPQSHY